MKPGLKKKPNGKRLYMLVMTSESCSGDVPRTSVTSTTTVTATTTVLPTPTVPFDPDVVRLCKCRQMYFDRL